MTRYSALRHAALGLVALALTGCASIPERVDEGPFDPLDPLRDILDMAERSGSSDIQLEILREAIAQGEVTRDQLTEAIEVTFSCLDDVGAYYVPLVFDDTGRRYPTYTYSIGLIPGMPRDEALAIADSCMYDNSFWVEMAYQSAQPAMIEAENEHFESLRPALLECLEENGLEIDSDASRDELSRAVLTVQFGPEGIAEIERKANQTTKTHSGPLVIEIVSSEDGSMPYEGPTSVGPNCFFEVGL